MEVEKKDMFLPFEEEEGEELKSVENRVVRVKAITGYEFHDPILLQEAFTHHSYEEEDGGGGCSASLERLAFIGDAILNFLVTKEQYAMFPDLDPGKLTRLRAINVDTEKLARVALQFRLHQFLRHNIPLLATQMREFRDATMEYPLHSCGLIDAPKVLADIVESLIGAIYLDSKSSINTTWQVVKNLLKPMITPETVPTHPVTQLQEMCQKNGFKLKMRDLWKETGEIEFVVDAHDLQQFIGRAKYSGKRSIAKSRAALDACSQIINTLT